MVFLVFLCIAIVGMMQMLEEVLSGNEESLEYVRIAKNSSMLLNEYIESMIVGFSIKFRILMIFWKISLNSRKESFY
jgi:hypothetical protein